MCIALKNTFKLLIKILIKSVMHAILTVRKIQLKYKTLRSKDSDFVINCDYIIEHKEILVTKQIILKFFKV